MCGIILGLQMPTRALLRLCKYLQTVTYPVEVQNPMSLGTTDPKASPCRLFLEKLGSFICVDCLTIWILPLASPWCNVTCNVILHTFCKLLDLEAWSHHRWAGNIPISSLHRLNQFNPLPTLISNAFQICLLSSYPLNYPSSGHSHLSPGLIRHSPNWSVFPILSTSNFFTQKPE